MIGPTHSLFLFLLACSSALGRVVNDNTIPEIVSNTLSEVDDVNKNQSLPEITKKQSVTRKTHASTTANPQSSCEQDSINEVNSEEEKPCKPEHKIDNGTALLLTPLIEDGHIEVAVNASKVNPELFLGINSYSGFLTVDKRYNSNIFFWYFPQDKRTENASWILWLQGGPGASSMTGLFDEIGPFRVFSKGVLKKNPYSWLQNHSLVFFDSPVGTGFSFTEHEDGFTTDLPSYTSHLYAALKQFLQLFPELKRAPLFLAGESYAGKYVPALAMQIHKFKDSPDGDINLKGLILGNAYTGPEMLTHLDLPFYYFGLIDKQQIAQLQPLMQSFSEDVAAGNSVQAKRKWVRLLTIILMLTNQQHAYNFLRDDLGIGRFTEFLKRSDIKRALHVGDIHYDQVNVTVNIKLEPEFLTSTKNFMEQILDHYQVLSYCGQLDQMIPCVASTENYLRWRWNGSEEFHQAGRRPYLFKNRLVGYYKSGGNLTEVVIRGAGHMVPLDAPLPLLNLVSRWTHGQSLALRTIPSNLIQGLVTRAISNNSTIYYL